VGILALIIAAFVFIPIAIAKIEYRIPQSLQTRGIDTQEKYIDYMKHNQKNR